MHSRYYRLLGMLLGLLWAAVVLAAPSPQFLRDTERLTAGDHRLTGSPEAERAAEYLATRLREVGVTKVITEEFPTVRLRVKRCDLTVGGKPLPLHPMRPNGIIPPVTPAGGLTAPLLYAGAGALADYGTRSPLGKIVVLDYNSDTAWLRAFRLGARAVIFTPSVLGQANSRAIHYVEANANLPRFYYAGDLAMVAPEGTVVTINSEVLWERATGRNVIGFLPGTNPKQALGQEAVVLGTHYDTFGEVPTLSPGARGAANCAALLESAGNLVRHRPTRDTAVVFFDAEAYGHAGATVFYRALEPKDDKPLGIEARKRSQQNESAFLAQMAEVLQSPESLGNTSAVHIQVLRRLERAAGEHVTDINAQMENLRLSGGAGAAERALLPEVQAALATLAGEKDTWNNLRRAIAIALNRRTADGLGNLRAEERRAVLLQVLEIVRQDVDRRRQELDAEMAALKTDEQLRGVLGSSFITLHVSMLLGDTTGHWGVIVGGDSALRNQDDQAGLYGNFQTAFLGAVKELGGAAANFERATADGKMNSRLFWAAPLVHGGEIAGRVCIFNLALGTVQERLPREGTPDDLLRNLNMDRVGTQSREVAAVLATVTSKTDLSVRRRMKMSKISYGPEARENGEVVGPNVKGLKPGSAMPDTPFPGTVIQLQVRPSGNAYLSTGYQFSRAKIPAFCNYQVLMADANACYGYGPVSNDTGKEPITAFAAKFDGRGEVEAVSNQGDVKLVNTRINLFTCAYTISRDGQALNTRRVGAAVIAPQVDSDNALVMQGVSDGIFDGKRSFSGTQDGIVFWYADKRYEDVKLFGLQSIVALMNRDPDAPETGYDRLRLAKWTGSGFSLLGDWEMPYSTLRSAADLWRLDQSRLDLLVDKGVTNSSIAELQGRAEDLLTAATQTNDVATSEALAASSFMAQRSVYASLRAALDDLVSAAIILLALAIPFAFALERLLIGATNIYRQIAWFVAFFLLTFIILLLVHPVFAIAGVSGQPVIIFLAFALICMSSLVIFVLMQKFETELKVLQGLTSTVHAADVSRFSTVMAAMSMGISTMRRRPLRTALTALTITLLTFTILNFASFDTRTGIVTLFEGSVKDYTGAFTHKVNWAAIDPEVTGVLQGRWKDRAAVTTRYWLPLSTTSTTDTSVPLLTRADGGAPNILRGVLGIDAAEVDYREDLRAMLGVEQAALQDGRYIFITSTLAKALGVAAGDEVLLGGMNLRVGSLLDASAVERVKDLDGNGILPVDFSAMASSSGSTTTSTPQQQTGADVLAAAQAKQEWVELPIDSVVIVSSDTARELGATLRALTVYTKKDTAAATQIAEDMTRMLPLPVTATRVDGVYTHVLAPTVSAKGLKDLIFPILLGGLVIFGTMLGSVADREREIYTFSALGLAPTHVATLFFAEAMVYSFIGGLGGYLLAQGVMKLLMFFADLGWMSVPEMNYSSFNAIITILLVMCTVLVSAIYPAIKASRSANPGVLRSWQLPAPEGDCFHIVFPFTVSTYDITGVISFLKEHFDNFAETGLGSFMAKATEIIQEDGKLGLQSLLALAPFDLGVTETFVLRSGPSEIPGIDEVIIDITRQSGQQKDWERLNKVLLDDLRKQFLIWRALPRETMEMYRNRTLDAMGQAKAETASEMAQPVQG